MNLLRTNQLQAILAGGAILSILVPLIIVIVLWFWARGAIASAIESIFPGEFGKTATNLVFGLLALYFVIKLLGRLAGR